MTARVFVDTNVLIYARDRKAAAKREHAQLWLAELARSGRLVINLQVINELTRWTLRSEPQRPIADVRSEIGALRTYGEAPVGVAETDLAWQIRGALGYQWFDCLLLASALTARCAYFLSEEMGDNARYDSLTIINPFRTSPKELIGSG